MHLLVPSILQAPSGELAIFDHGEAHRGCFGRWDVARPTEHGWEAIGSISQGPDGYRGWASCELRALPTVTDAAEALAANALDYDAEHGLPAPLSAVPADGGGFGWEVSA